MESYYIAHGTQLSVMYYTGWEGRWGRMDTCICMAESLHYSPETITILLIDYTPIQNKKLKKTQLSAVQSMKKIEFIYSVVRVYIWFSYYKRAF